MRLGDCSGNRCLFCRRRTGRFIGNYEGVMSKVWRGRGVLVDLCDDVALWMQDLG